MSTSRLERKAAVPTVSEAFERALALPLVFGGFLLAEVLLVVGNHVVPGLPLVSGLLWLIFAGITYVYVDARIDGRTLAFESVARRVLGRLLSLIGLSILYVIVVFVGLLVFVLPGIYVGARFVLAFPACVLEDQGAVDSLHSSWAVADGNVQKLVGIGILLAIAVAVVGGVESVAGGLAGFDLPAALAVAPLVAILTAIGNVAIARVYLENRPTVAERTGESGASSGRAVR